MTVEARKETMGFQSEAKQLLHLMIHSLYSNKEVFLRELISNASDAADRLRFAALTDGSLMEADPDLKIRVDFDKKARTITVSDNGIGMTRQEAIDHLGTIAKSGTASFLQSLSGDKRKDSQLIGQFGVGFYSSFIVADKVTVETRKAGLPPTEGVRWVSSGESEFEVETIDRPARGTSVILHLKKEELDFADQWRLQTIVKKYADHISIPVIMKVEPFSSGEDDKKPEPEDKVINTAKALWTRPRTELKDEEYQEFYRHISHDFQDPIAWSHNKVEGKLDYTSLIYIPAKAPFDLYQREAPRGLKLYVQRIFIMDDAEQFLPLYLRFVKGVVDSNDLSLNVSREILQKEPAIETIRGALTKRVLDMLEKLAKKEPEKYASFWSEFGQVLKEGPAEDHANRERIAKLLRFATTFADSKGQDQSLESYVGRMRPEQKKIYYVAAESYQTASRSPHLEVFRRKGVEVLLLHDRIDEWLMSHLSEFDGKQFQDVARGNLDLDALDETEKAQQEQAAEEFKGLVERVREVLGEQVADVRITHRLVESPACLVVGEHDMGMQMRRILEAAGQKPRESKRIFEINPGHPLVKRLNDEQDLDRFGELTRILLDQAQLAEGGQLEDPATYVQRLNKLLLELSA